MQQQQKQQLQQQHDVEEISFSTSVNGSIGALGDTREGYTQERRDTALAEDMGLNLQGPPRKWLYSQCVWGYHR